ncbi:MAG: hypothetical protein KA054_03640 [Candidatus Moranbacteria bacterium]|jgi:hypothetical protein|nr:hypothetical protein [Candidatus Moranbacteria bacterium]
MDFLLSFISTLGLVLAVGSSTYAITFFQQSLLDGRIDKTEQRFLHTVYLILRLGMVLLAVSVLWRMVRISLIDAPLFSDTTLWFQFTLLLIVNVNAILMDRHLIPMWLGPAIAGGSWYGYFFSVILTPFSFSYPLLLLYWACLVIFFIIFLRILNEFSRKK